VVPPAVEPRASAADWPAPAAAGPAAAAAAAGAGGEPGSERLVGSLPAEPWEQLVGTDEEPPDYHQEAGDDETGETWDPLSDHNAAAAADVPGTSVDAEAATAVNLAEEAEAPLPPVLIEPVLAGLSPTDSVPGSEVLVGEVDSPAAMPDLNLAQQVSGGEAAVANTEALYAILADPPLSEAVEQAAGQTEALAAEELPPEAALVDSVRTDAVEITSPAASSPREEEPAEGEEFSFFPTGRGTAGAAVGRGDTVLSRQHLGSFRRRPRQQVSGLRALVRSAVSGIGLLASAILGLIIPYYFINLLGGPRFDVIPIPLPGVRHTYKHLERYPRLPRFGIDPLASTEDDRRPNTSVDKGKVAGAAESGATERSGPPDRAVRVDTPSHLEPGKRALAGTKLDAAKNPVAAKNPEAGKKVAKDANKDAGKEGNDDDLKAAASAFPEAPEIPK
jgi:hypothetical protein